MPWYPPNSGKAGATDRARRDARPTFTRKELPLMALNLLPMDTNHDELLTPEEAGKILKVTGERFGN
jgi:hypothetical protein